jgi:hypothetical protein
MPEIQSQRRTLLVHRAWMLKRIGRLNFSNMGSPRAIFFFSLCALLLAGTSLPAQPTVTIGQNYPSSTYNVNSTALPPDANGAIGSKQFVEFINGTVAMYNKTNGVRMTRKTDVKFWADAGVIVSSDSAVTDPRVIFDPLSQRWYATQVDFDATASDPTLESNDFLFALSDTSDATGTWHGFSFQADPDTGFFADFPTLGVDSNAVYISGDFFFGNSSPVGPGLLSIPKSDLLTNTPSIANRTWFGVMDYSVRGQVLQPVTCFDGSSSGNILSVGDIGMTSDFHSNLVSFAVLNSATTNATLTASTNLIVLPYMVPDNAVEGAPLLTPTQPDDTQALQANDARLSAKVYAVNGVIYAVHNTELNNRIAIRWYRINATTRTLMEMGTIADANLDLFFPSIAANSNGVVMICCNGCGLGTFVSSFAYPGATVNGVTTFGPSVLLQSGTTSYHGDDEQLADLLDTPPLSRWGDYSATSVDPNNSSNFWTIQMIPTDTDVWTTQITQLIVSQAVQPPTLRIAAAGQNVQFSWPSSATGFQLQSASTLSPTPNWATLSPTLVTNGNSISAVLPISGAQNFFRLKQGP